MSPVGRSHRLGNTLGHDLCECPWLQESRQSADEKAHWRVSAGCPPSSQLVLWVPLRTEWPEEALLPRVVDPGRSHAHEIGALKIELQAEPHGPGFSSGEASWGHIKDAAEATHAPSAAARAQRPHEEELFPQSGLERGHAGSAFRTGPFVIFGVRRGWRRSLRSQPLQKSMRLKEMQNPSPRLARAQVSNACRSANGSSLGSSRLLRMEKKREKIGRHRSRSESCSNSVSRKTSDSKRGLRER